MKKIIRTLNPDNYQEQWENVDLSNNGNGKDGKDGLPGKDGKDGYTPVKGKDYFDGKTGPAGRDGKDGIGGGVNSAQMFGFKSVLDFGAKSGASDNTQAFQDCADWCIEHNVQRMFVPNGKFYNEDPTVVMKLNSFCTLNIIGEGSAWDSNLGSEIIYTGSDAFAIGIQNGKGCSIRGLNISSIFKPPVTVQEPMKFFNTKFDDFGDGVCRDSVNSPHCLIPIDPLSNLTGELPADGGYKNKKIAQLYGQWKSLGSSAGSTHTTIQGNYLRGGVVGIASSVNGFTRNAEITHILDNQFSNMKLCVSGGHEQEKANVISGFYSWEGVHTFFATGEYGQKGSITGQWNIDDGNLAGGIIRFMSSDAQGYFAVTVSGKPIFTEMIGYYGKHHSRLACNISNLNFDFASKSLAGERDLIYSFGESEAKSLITFRDCNFRYYDNSEDDLHIKSNAKFDNCYWSGKLITNPSYT